MKKHPPFLSPIYTKMLLLICLCLLTLVSTSQAQDDDDGIRPGSLQPSLHFNHLTVEDGLPHKNIEAIFQDSRGFI